MKLSTIVSVSIENLKLFCEVKKQGNHFIFRDSSQPDKYYHNYTFLGSNQNYHPAQVQAYYQQAVENNDVFFMIKIDEVPVDITPWKLLGTPIIDENLYFYAPLEHIQPGSKKSVLCKRVETEDFDLLEQMLFDGSKQYGEEYARKNAQHRLKVLQHHPDRFQCYFVYQREEVVGYLFTIIYQQWAELDDFWILPDHQKQGFGSGLLHYVLSQLKQQGIRDVFLMADKNDTPKEMYAKMKFEVAGACTMLRWMLKD